MNFKFCQLQFASFNQSKEILKAVTEQFSKIAPVFPSVLRTIAFADAAMQHLPLGIYEPKHLAPVILDSISQSLEAL